MGCGSPLRQPHAENQQRSGAGRDKTRPKPRKPSINGQQELRPIFRLYLALLVGFRVVPVFELLRRPRLALVNNRMFFFN